LSHAHYDHLPGARWFERFYLCRGEIPVLDTYTEEAYLRRVLAQARIRGILPAGFDEGSFLGTDYRRRAREELPQLPGLELIPLPGHTPGSLVLYVREYRLLLTGDNWNPVTWLFFPEAVPVGDYAENMRRLLPPDYRWALCPHSRELIPGGRLRRFVDGLRPALFGAAEPAETPYPAIKTLGCRPEPESLLVFRA
jgi:glyoxylase-like metal-dependent hydrolase (beta-lactamase superfamily II)